MALSFINPFRPRKDNEHSLKIPTLILAGTAAFALLAPTAGAAGNKSARHVGPSSHLTAHRAIKHKSTIGSKSSKPAKKITTVAKVKPVVPKQRVVPYIYVPAGVSSTPPYVDPNGCADSGTDCTDVQLCEFWGMNCDSLPTFAYPNPATTTGTPTGPDPAAG
jgi:hypothetical protein